VNIFKGRTQHTFDKKRDYKECDRFPLNLYVGSITSDLDMILQAFNYCLHHRFSWRKVGWKCLQCSSVLIWSIGICSLGVSKLLAADTNSVSLELLDSGNSPSELRKQISPVTSTKNLQPTSSIETYEVGSMQDKKNFHELEKSTSIHTQYSSTNLPSSVEKTDPMAEVLHTSSSILQPSDEGFSIELHYPLKPPSMQLAAPENFNPGLRLPPPQAQPSVQPTPPPTSTEPVTEAIKLESLTTDFRRDGDNFEQRNQFIEETAQFRLRNGNRFRIKTGFNSFEQRNVESVTNIPLHVEWEGKIDQVTVIVGGGVDVFDRLPTALNFNAKVEAPFAIKVSPSGRLQSGVVVSAVVEQSPYKFNAQTLDNQITAWRFGPSIYWQIDANTSLYSSLRLGSYNDGNFEQQSFSRIERKFGQFFVAANVFNWNYRRDVEKTSGYFSPPDFLIYNGEIGWDGNIIESLRCRVAANLGQQRLEGEWDVANSYQARCTAKLSPNVEADFGYAYSNVQNRQSEGSGYNNQSFTGQLRVKF
jgi:hypothetical protein